MFSRVVLFQNIVLIADTEEHLVQGRGRNGVEFKPKIGAVLFELVEEANKGSKCDMWTQRYIERTIAFQPITIFEGEISNEVTDV